MSTAMLPPPADPVDRFTVDQYFRMVEAGILSEKDKVELIHGVIRPKTAKGNFHETMMEALMNILAALVPTTYSFRCQSPVRLSDSAPEPDFVICTTAKQRKGKHPKVDEVFLVIEVADSSLEQDQIESLELYAGAGIPVYWIVNLVDRQIEIFTGPTGTKRGLPKYRSVAIYGPGQEVPVVVKGMTIGKIAVSILIP
jgi:Uma2 family endonuclease